MNIPIDITGVVLTTERLTLRPWRESDLEDFYEYAKVDGVGQMAGWLPHESIETSKMILKNFMTHMHTFAIEYEGKVIGSLGVEAYDEEAAPELIDKKGRELGVVLSKDYWGRGLVPEAAKRVIKWLFEEVGLDFITCCHFKDNAQSVRVQQKLGFRYYKDCLFETRWGENKDSKMNILYRKLFHTFSSQEERREYGGSAFIEIQFCKLAADTPVREIIKSGCKNHWMNDSLYVDEENRFFREYANILDCGIYENMESGKVDIFGINYYSPDVVESIMKRIDDAKPADHEVFHEWLDRSKQYNGFYILGI